jgi:hypothetical protein
LCLPHSPPLTFLPLHVPPWQCLLILFA